MSCLSCVLSLLCHVNRHQSRTQQRRDRARSEEMHMPLQHYVSLFISYAWFIILFIPLMLHNWQTLLYMLCQYSIVITFWGEIINTYINIFNIWFSFCIFRKKKDLYHYFRKVTIGKHLSKWLLCQFVYKVKEKMSFPLQLTCHKNRLWF